MNSKKKSKIWKWRHCPGNPQSKFTLKSKLSKTHSKLKSSKTHPKSGTSIPYFDFLPSAILSQTNYFDQKDACIGSNVYFIGCILTFPNQVMAGRKCVPLAAYSLAFQVAYHLSVNNCEKFQEYQMVFFKNVKANLVHQNVW